MQNTAVLVMRSALPLAWEPSISWSPTWVAHFVTLDALSLLYFALIWVKGYLLLQYDVHYILGVCQALLAPFVYIAYHSPVFVEGSSLCLSVSLFFSLSVVDVKQCFRCCDFVIQLNIAACGLLMWWVIWGPKLHCTVYKHILFSAGRKLTWPTSTEVKEVD